MARSGPTRTGPPLGLCRTAGRRRARRLTRPSLTGSHHGRRGLKPTKTPRRRLAGAGSGTAETWTGWTAYRSKATSSGATPPVGVRASRRALAEAPTTPPVAVLECENDEGGRFTIRPFGNSHRTLRPSACAVASCGLAARPPLAGRAASAVAGATPLAEGSVRHSGERVFTPSPLMPGVAPAKWIPAGRPCSAAIAAGEAPVRRALVHRRRAPPRSPDLTNRRRQPSTSCAPVFPLPLPLGDPRSCVRGDPVARRLPG